MFPRSLTLSLSLSLLLHRGRLFNTNAISLWICPFLSLSENGERASSATSSASSSSRTTVSFCTSSANLHLFLTPLPSTFSIPPIRSTSSCFSQPPTHSTRCIFPLPFISSPDSTFPAHSFILQLLLFFLLPTFHLSPFSSLPLFIFTSMFCILLRSL
ncbi:hypothetical protein VNO78_20317 [Psophocarpus tetragonolobus]|uniref:Uncharacterized protein n=1 Tax=Psophocarpus tetragonolobus TaxID=3891 RepID=A0AAN9S956_PSOTE